MSTRRRRPSLEDRLDQLSALRRDPDSAETVAALRQALTGKESLLAARAARVTGDLGKTELVPEMLEAFERFMKDPVKTDKGCYAKLEIAKALLEMEHPATALFLRGIRHIQLEPSWGDPVDAAIELRANCALALANSTHPDTVLELVPLLLDQGLPVRLAAAQGIAGAGQLSAEAVLRFKVLVGDEEPEVLMECLVGLLRLSPRRSIELIRPMLGATGPRPAERGEGAARREAAILALGESRMEEAIPLLQEQWKKSYDPESRRMVLLALVTTRRETAVDFLLALIVEGEVAQAREAISALGIHRHDGKIRDRVHEVLERREGSELKDSDGLARHFAEEFS